MTETEQLADIIALSIHAALEPIQREIAALKLLAPIPGPRGERGDPGTIGLKGLDGAVGQAGERGPMGEVGQRGPMGEHGESGLNGKDGRDGLDGKDGAIGLTGKDGRDGLDGKDGAPGLQGKDGQDATLDPMLIDRLTAVEIKADLAQRIERDVIGLKTQVLNLKSLDSSETIPPDRFGAVLADILATELAALRPS